MILHDAVFAALFAAGFLALFAVAERLRRRDLAPPEVARKLVHVGGCLGAMLFPFAFRSPWSVVALALVFSLTAFPAGAAATSAAAGDGTVRKSAAPAALYAEADDPVAADCIADESASEDQLVCEPVVIDAQAVAEAAAKEKAVEEAKKALEAVEDKVNNQLENSK